jgi:polyhydroxybutyrate depolymerase
VPDLRDLTQPGKHRVQFSVDGLDRLFLFYTPAQFTPGMPRPLVMFLHGAGGTAEQAFRTYNWPAKADSENFFVVFPQGLGVRRENQNLFRIWRDERTGSNGGIDDMHFLQTILDDIQSAVPIDPRRVYISGFSNGAAMTFAFGARFSERIAAMAPVSSQSFVHIDRLTRPLPVYYLAGTEDPLIPFRGGRAELPPEIPIHRDYHFPAIYASAEKWAKLNGCTLPPRVIEDANGVRVERYEPSPAGAEVLFTTIQGNGHHWPGTIEPLPRALSGPTLDPFDATQRIWDFFAGHSLS